MQVVLDIYLCCLINQVKEKKESRVDWTETCPFVSFFMFTSKKPKLSLAFSVDVEHKSHPNPELNMHDVPCIAAGARSLIVSALHW